MCFERGANSGGRNHRIFYLLGDVFEVRARFGQIVGHTDFHRMFAVRHEIVNVDGAELLVDDCAGTRGHVLDWQSVIRHHLGDFF